METSLLERTFASRKEHVVGAQVHRHAIVHRAAEDLSRRTVDLAVVELLMEAALAATALAYERDPDTGALVNLDPRTGRALYALPWGRAGHRKWGLTPSECNQLRWLMFDRQTAPAALWLYDAARRSWWVQRTVYRTVDQALDYWRHTPITVTDLRRARAALVARQVAR